MNIAQSNSRPIIWMETSSCIQELGAKWSHHFEGKGVLSKTFGVVFASALPALMIAGQWETLPLMVEKVILLSSNALSSSANCMTFILAFQKTAAKVALVGVLAKTIQGCYTCLPFSINLKSKFLQEAFDQILNNPELNKENFDVLQTRFQNEITEISTKIEKLKPIDEKAKEEFTNLKRRVSHLAGMIVNFDPTFKTKIANEKRLKNAKLFKERINNTMDAIEKHQENFKIELEVNEAFTELDVFSKHMKQKMVDLTEILAENETLILAENETLADDPIEFRPYAQLHASGTTNMIEGKRAYEYVAEKLGISDEHLDLCFTRSGLFSMEDFKEKTNNLFTDSTSKKSNEKRYWDIIIEVLRKGQIETSKKGQKQSRLYKIDKFAATLFAVSFKALYVVTAAVWWNAPSFFGQSLLGLGLGLTGRAVKNNVSQFSQGSSSDRLAWIFLSNAPAFFVGNSIGILLYSRSTRVAVKTLFQAYFF